MGGCWRGMDERGGMFGLIRGSMCCGTVPVGGVKPLNTVVFRWKFLLTVIIYRSSDLVWMLF